MTDEKPDPIREAFLADQADAEAEAVSRDGVQWRLNVETVQTDLQMKRAHARRTEAMGSLLEAVTLGFYLILLAGIVGGVYLAVRIAMGWFR